MSSVFFTGWRPDGAGIRRGDSYSVRFRHPDLPGAVITRTAYAVESEQHLGEFYVQVQTESTLCTDPERPGDTENLVQGRLRRLGPHLAHRRGSRRGRPGPHHRRDRRERVLPQLGREAVVMGAPAAALDHRDIAKPVVRRDPGQRP